MTIRIDIIFFTRQQVSVDFVEAAALHRSLVILIKLLYFDGSRVWNSLRRKLLNTGTATSIPMLDGHLVCDQLMLEVVETKFSVLGRDIWVILVAFSGNLLVNDKLVLRAS